MRALSPIPTEFSPALELQAYTIGNYGSAKRFLCAFLLAILNALKDLDEVTVLNVRNEIRG
jgi:hypothetical protein